MEEVFLAKILFSHDITDFAHVLTNRLHSKCCHTSFDSFFSNCRVLISSGRSDMQSLKQLLNEAHKSVLTACDKTL